MKIQSGHVELEVEDRGGDGVPIVLVMGLGAQRVLWPADFCDMLTAAGLRVILFDNRDAGESTHLRQLPVPNTAKMFMQRAVGRPVDAAYTLSHMADDILAVLDALHIERAHIAGISMGGMIAQTFCIEHPERALSLISLSSTPGCRRYQLMTHPRALRALLSRAPRTREQAGEHYVRLFRIIGSKMRPADETFLRDKGALSFDRGMNPAGFVRQLAAICASGSRRKALRSLRMPTLVIHGKRDPLITIRAGRATASLVRGATFVELPEVGHDLPRASWRPIADAIVSHTTAAHA